MAVVKQLFLLLLVASAAWALEPAEKILAKAAALNPDLLDYSAELELPLQAQFGFVPYRKTLRGRYYFKRPDKHKLDLQNAPAALKKYPNVFGLNLPDLKRYRVLKIQELNLRGTIPVYKIMTVPNPRTSDIIGIDVYVNRLNYSVPKYDTFYAKGHLYVDIDFRSEGKYLVYDTVRADFEFPNILAKATASYRNYQFNQKLSDEFFR